MKRNILFIADPPPGGNGGNKLTIESLTAEIAAKDAVIASLTEKVNAFTAQAKQASADEEVIREKMAHGLTRDQAIAVIKRQRAHDEAEAAAAKAKAEKSTKK